METTDIEVPQTMQLESTPAPEPIKSENDEIPVFKDEVREGIFAKRRELLEREMLDQGLEPQGSDPVEPAAHIEAPKVKATPVATPVIEEPIVSPEQEKFLLNVYGETKELTKDELIREAQKGMAASQIFHEGHRMRDEALQIANSVKQHLQPQAAKENPPAPPSIIDTDNAKEIARRINYGSEEDQINAIKDLGASIEAKVRGQHQSLPPEQLVNIATQQTLAIIEARKEQDTLKAEFKDVLEDRYIAAAADAIANELAVKYRDQEIPKSRLELFREAGLTVRERYLRNADTNPPENPAPPVIVVDNKDKIERKRAAPKPPAAANKIATEPPPAYGVGVSSIVNQMRKSRGQPILN